MDTVSSADGTTIGSHRTGSGPALGARHRCVRDRGTTTSLARSSHPTSPSTSTTGAVGGQRRDRPGHAPSGRSRTSPPSRPPRVKSPSCSVTPRARCSPWRPRRAACRRRSSSLRAAVHRRRQPRPVPAPDLADRIAALVSADRRDDAAKLFLHRGGRGAAGGDRHDRGVTGLAGHDVDRAHRSSVR